MIRMLPMYNAVTGAILTHTGWRDGQRRRLTVFTTLSCMLAYSAMDQSTPCTNEQHIPRMTSLDDPNRSSFIHSFQALTTVLVPVPMVTWCMRCHHNKLLNHFYAFITYTFGDWYKCRVES